MFDGNKLRTNIIWIKNRKYYLYDTYSDRKQAVKIGKYFKKKNHSKYFILNHEKGYWFPRKTYTLYLTRVFRLY